jgi:hypothetical protein
MNIERPSVSFLTTLDLFTKGIYVFKTIQPQETTVAAEGVYDCLIRIPANLLSETMYTVNVSVATRNGKPGVLSLPNALTFMVYGSNDAALYKGGVVTPKLDWQVTQVVAVEKPAQ